MVNRSHLWLCLANGLRLQYEVPPVAVYSTSSALSRAELKCRVLSQSVRLSTMVRLSGSSILGFKFRVPSQPVEHSGMGVAVALYFLRDISY